MVTVRNNMDTRIVCVDHTTKIMEALKMCIKSGVWSFVVLKDGLPVGVVTDRDILKRCIVEGMDPTHESVERIMSAPLISIGPDAPIAEALKLMTDNDIKRVFVVEKGKIIGRVTQTGAFRRLLSLIIGLESVPRTL